MNLKQAWKNVGPGLVVAATGLGAGDIVGEMGLLSDEPRSATATASTDLVLLQLRKMDFDALLATN